MNDIITEKEDQVLIIKLDRPTKKNALTISMYDNLTKLFKEAHEDKDTRAVVLTSSSDTFSAGNDIVDFKNNPPIEDDAPVYNFVRTIVNFDKPIIAGVDGLAVGLGMSILLHCDFVYVTEKTKLMAPFVNLGLIPEFGSSKLLVDTIGSKRASRMFMLGEIMPGKDAVEFGLASELTTSEELHEKTYAMAKTLSQKPVEALRQTINFLRPKNELLKLVNEEIEQFKVRVQSNDAQEAISAILEKRHPKFE